MPPMCATCKWYDHTDTVDQGWCRHTPGTTDDGWMEFTKTRPTWRCNDWTNVTPTAPQRVVTQATHLIDRVRHTLR